MRFFWTPCQIDSSIPRQPGDFVVDSPAIPTFCKPLSMTSVEAFGSDNPIHFLTWPPSTWMATLVRRPDKGKQGMTSPTLHLGLPPAGIAAGGNRRSVVAGELFGQSAFHEGSGGRHGPGRVLPNVRLPQAKRARGYDLRKEHLIATVRQEPCLSLVSTSSPEPEGDRGWICQ